MYLGDYVAGDTIDFNFTTRRFSSGAPFTLAGTPAVRVYKGSSTTEDDSGITLTVDFDSRTGCNHVTIDTSADGTFYANGGQFEVMITAGTVDSVSVVGEIVGRFTLRAQASLYPTTAGRTLDVSAGGEAGLDWANIGSPTTAQNLSGTNIDTDQVIASVTGAVGSVTGNVGGNVGGNVTGSVGSVTAGVTVTTNNDKTGMRLSATGVGDILTSALTESYAADGAAFTVSQALYEIAQSIGDFDIAGTTLTVKQRDGTTTAMTYTLDDDTNPTSRTRAT